MQSELNTAKHFQNYLVGEIHANFLDEDDIDRATANRESAKKDDPLYQLLLHKVRTVLHEISEQWDEWRIALNQQANNPINESLNEWLNTLEDPRDRKSAEKLINSITKATLHTNKNTTEELEAKKTLFRGVIVGFEKLKLTKQLYKLDQIKDVLSPEFAALFASLADIEETAYSQITRERLEIIKKFKNITNDSDTLEKVAQKYLFENLWLLDPSWDRVSGRGEFELTLTNHLKTHCPDEKTGARLDISYRCSSSHHVVIELKRPRKKVSFDELDKQARKYRRAVEAYYKDTESGRPLPSIQIYLLVDKAPFMDDRDRRSLYEQGAQIITYEQLINDSYNAYQAYLDAGKSTNKIDEILERLN